MNPMPAAIYHFPLDGEPVSAETYGSGHINKTYLVATTTGRKYILQRISEVFDIPALMANIVAVTDHIAAHTSDPRGYMHLIFDNDGRSYYTDDTGSYRLYDYIEGSVCLEKAETEEDFYQSAVAFGSFEQLLSDFPAEVLNEPIPNFHNTTDRYRIFRETLYKDPMGRAAGVGDEIGFALAREEAAGTLQSMRERGELPVRVTHNDTKLNNVMLDKETHRALCVIDLDTVMPGLSLYDYGDAIRYGAATAAEDERDLSKVKFDLGLFRAYTEGYLSTCTDLTEREVCLMPLGAWTMTLECGLRFLTDYLDGDRYFAVGREGHNLDRCRTQFKMAREMELNYSEMRRIVEAVRDIR